MSDLASLQTGTVTIASGSASQTASLSAITLADAMLFYGVNPDNSAGPSPSNCEVRGRLTSTTQATFDRQTASANTVTVRYFVIEFSDGITVEHLAGSGNDTGTIDITCTARTLASSVPLYSKNNQGSSTGNDDFETVTYTSTTNIQVALAAPFSSSSAYGVQSVEYTDAAVQTGTANIADGSASTTATLSPAVTLARTFLVVYWQNTNSVGNPAGYGVRSRLTSTTQITFDRVGTTGALPIRYHAVELPTAGLLQVEEVAVAFSTSQTQKDSTLATTLTDASKTAVLINATNWSLGKANYTTTDNNAVAEAMAYPLNTTTLRADRGVTGSVALDATAYVIEWGAASGATIPVGQVSETDLAQAITKLKRKAVGQVMEADLGQAVTRRKMYALGQISEIDLSQAIGRVKTKVLGQVVETDLPQIIGWPPTRLISQVGESDLSQVVSGVKSRLLGQPAEVDLAQNTTWAPKNRLIEQASESDLSQGVTSKKTLIIGLVTESDLSQLVTPSGQKIIAVAQVVEADSAQLIGRLKTKSLGQVSELDLSQAVTRLKTLQIGQVIEADLSQVINWAPKHRLVGQTLETDLAQIVTPAAAVVLSRLDVLSLQISSDLSKSIVFSGNVLPIAIVSSAPSGSPPGGKGIVFRVAAGVVTIYVWDGAAWRSLS